MTQEEFNESTLKALTQLTETLSDMGKTRDAMFQAMQLDSNRIDSAENRIDILMSERGDRIADEPAKKSHATDTENLEELPKYYDEPEAMTWHEAMAKYKDHPDYRLMTKEELIVACTDEEEDAIGSFYWSSSESSPNYSWVVYFNSGDELNHPKEHSLNVRVVNREMVDCKTKGWGTDEQIDESQDLRSEDLFRLLSKHEDFEKSIDEHLERDRNSIIDDDIDRIAETTITPKALLDLGFTEEYQPPIYGMAGFIYYDFSKHGIDLLSNTVSNEEPLYVFFENQFEIHNLRKLGDFILSLNEL